MHYTASETVESRILDLLKPFRDEYFTGNMPQEDPGYASAEKLERLTMALAYNIAFLARNHRLNVQKRSLLRMKPDDISLAVYGWDGKVIGQDGGVITVFVRHNAAMQPVVRAVLQPGDNVVAELAAVVDNGLKSFI
ncbi:hypothetical protein FB567DRAFT_630336 [Paraphoma chrysanthemicola]|uniref:Uncharacterized protein n=1 Tax=Paraphoma chrysanthemicola TaxID=798071 RepID=A0A8K0VWS6_9PLEO|nr:hypothetical protein FB567DRAFT_630336 [Paraphoma chrysanthemicola]